MSTLDALQTALAAEHAALHVYGALGARTSAAATPALFGDLSTAYAAHRGRRDALVREITDLDGTPVAAAPVYELPGRLATTQGVAAAALDVERSCAATYAWLVGETAGPVRRRAIEALTESAVRELVFRGTPEMLPGTADFADR